MDGELLSLKWNNHRTTFLHVIGSLRNKATYTDATLACEGKFYQVHRLVLSTCSEYFGAIFEKTPCKSPVVVLKDIECKNLEFLLDYMYIGEVNVRQNELSALIKAAECLRIKGLAVPDEDPSHLTHNSTKERLRSDSHRDSSPPAKRRRSRHFSSDEKKYIGRKDNISLDESVNNRQKPSESNDVIDNQSVIKLEPADIGLDSESEGTFAENIDDNNEELRSDDGGGTEENERDNTSNDLVEFFKETVEKEEPVSLGDYSSDFAGPSGVQNSNNAQWDSENSFPSESLSLGTANNSASQADPQHQQQMRKEMFLFQSLTSCGAQDNYTEKATNVPSLLLHSAGSKRKHSCPFCSYTSAYRHHLITHICVHTGEKRFKCSKCDYGTGDRGNFCKHVRIHTDRKLYNCPHCDYKSVSQSYIKNHILKKHSLEQL